MNRLREIYEQAYRLWNECRDKRHLDGETLIVELKRVFGAKERA